MKTKSWKKRIGSVVLCGMIGTCLHTAMQPLPAAHAANIGGILGTVIQDFVFIAAPRFSLIRSRVTNIPGIFRNRIPSIV